MLIHKTPAGLSPRLIPSSPQSLSIFSNSMCGLFRLLDFSLMQAQSAISQESPMPVPQTLSAFHVLEQRNVTRRRDVRLQQDWPV